MRRQKFILIALVGLLCVPPLLSWRSMLQSQKQADAALANMTRTQNSVTSILNVRSNQPADASGSFGQADAVRLVNSALIEAGLTPSIASELALRDDPVRRQGQDAGRLQRLTIMLRPIETQQLGRALRQLKLSLPSFTPAEIGLQRPSGLNDTDTRYSVRLAFEREYAAQPETP